MRGEKLYIIIIIVAIGLCFELIKSARQGRLSENGISATELANMDLRPFSRSDLDADEVAQHRDRFRMGRVTGLTQKENNKSDESYSFDGTKEESQAQKDKKKKKKSKKKAEKKKKKKKKVAKKKSPPSSQLDDGWDEDVADEDESTAPSLPVGGLGPQTSPENAGNELPVGYEDWAREVLQNPDFAATNKLIKYYQLNLVDEATFYRLVNEMLTDPRAQMNEMGIRAAAATPSYASFMVLAQFMENNPQGSPLRNSAYSQMLTTYTALHNIRILEPVLNSESTFAVILALQIATESAQMHLKPTGSEPPGNGQAGEQSTTVENGKYFSGIYTISKRLAVDSEDQRINQAAAQTASTLEPWMNGQLVSQF